MGDTYTVERTTTIDATPDRVFDHIVNFRNWEAWSPWAELDPAMKTTYSGPDAGPGARYAWSGNRKVGEGQMEISAADEHSDVEIALEFVKPFKASNTTTFSLRPEGGATAVTWSMTGRKTFLTKVMGIFKSMDAMMGSDFEKGLARLKTVVESGD